MAFDNLAPQGPINPNADAYGAEALCLSREAARSTRCVLDVAYGSDPLQTLDIYLPDDREARGLPVLVFIHGGGWSHGYKEWMGLNAPPVVAFPAVFVSVSYRLHPKDPFPAPLEDCVAALAWCHRNIAVHGGSPDRLFVGGHSAGGQLAALVALRRDLIAAAGLPADVVRACFPVSSTFNRRVVNPPPGQPAPQYDWNEIHPESPIALAAGNRVPFYVVWGGREHERLGITGRRLVAALLEAGSRVEHVVFPEHDHFSIHLDQRRPDNPWVRKVREWMTAG